jgi:hypothetical protein
MNLSTSIAEHIEEAIARLAPEPQGHINYEGVLHHALPLFGTIGEVWLLRPDGSLWRQIRTQGPLWNPSRKTFTRLHW